jgi:hypothetical protein
MAWRRELEQRAWSKEHGAESMEQRAWSRGHINLTIRKRIEAKSKLNTIEFNNLQH